MPTTKTAATETLTDDMIRALRDEAGEHGDDEMVACCDDALSGLRGDNMIAARQECARAINDARAQDDSQTYVAVVA
jgi:hypothetical protein